LHYETDATGRQRASTRKAISKNGAFTDVHG
jgi:hypothetical protein